MTQKARATMRNAKIAALNLRLAPDALLTPLHSSYMLCPDGFQSPNMRLE